jgi:hypothetical protein
MFCAQLRREVIRPLGANIRRSACSFPETAPYLTVKHGQHTTVWSTPDSVSE